MKSNKPLSNKNKLREDKLHTDNNQKYKSKPNKSNKPNKKLRNE